MSAMPDDRLLLDAYVDGELDPANALAFERRLAADPALERQLNRLAALRTAVRERLPRAAASAELRRRVAALAQPPAAAGAPRRRGRSWAAALAACMVAAFAAGSAATWLSLGAAPDPLPERLVASHMRGLMANDTVEVTSSDRHVVKPWFNGRLPGSPRVVNLAAAGFALVGGRIDIIGLTPVPTLVYRARLHVISLTALPPGDRRAAPPRAINGYNIVQWNDGGVAYWAVSDLAMPDLESFAAAFRAGDPEP